MNKWIEALKNNKLSEVKFLEASGEDVSIFDMAITYDNIKMVEFFLDKGIDVNVTNRKSGFTPLMCASCYGRIEIAKILLDYDENAPKNTMYAR